MRKEKERNVMSINETETSLRTDGNEHSSSARFHTVARDMRISACQEKANRKSGV